jgi:hypothetical protein
MYLPMSVQNNELYSHTKCMFSQSKTWKIPSTSNHHLGYKHQGLHKLYNMLINVPLLAFENLKIRINIVF